MFARLFFLFAMQERDEDCFFSLLSFPLKAIELDIALPSTPPPPSQASGESAQSHNHAKQEQTLFNDLRRRIKREKNN